MERFKYNKTQNIIIDTEHLDNGKPKQYHCQNEIDMKTVVNIMNDTNRKLIKSEAKDRANNL